jgi:DNA-binding transcriptional ArsR family regulator
LFPRSCDRSESTKDIALPCILRRAGLVKGRRDGKWIHYSLAEPHDGNAATIFHELNRPINNARDLDLHLDGASVDIRGTTVRLAQAFVSLV